MTELHERIDLENRLTKIEGVLDSISSILKELTEKFSGHTHPEIERDYEQVKKDVNDIGYKVERVRLNVEEDIREMLQKIEKQEKINLKQEILLEQIKEEKKNFSSRFWTIATGVSILFIASLGAFFLKNYALLK